MARGGGDDEAVIARVVDENQGLASRFYMSTQRPPSSESPAAGDEAMAWDVRVQRAFACPFVQDARDAELQTSQ